PHTKKQFDQVGVMVNAAKSKAAEVPPKYEAAVKALEKYDKVYEEGVKESWEGRSKVGDKPYQAALKTARAALDKLQAALPYEEGKPSLDRGMKIINDMGTAKDTGTLTKQYTSDQTANLTKLTGDIGTKLDEVTNAGKACDRELETMKKELDKFYKVALPNNV